VRMGRGMSTTSVNRLRAMIVDGEDAGRRILRSLLDSDRDVEEVREARSAAEARPMISERRPDLVFVDVGNPADDSVALLRESGARPYLIGLAATPDSALRAFELEADDMLLKPVEPRRFVRSVLRAKRRIAERLVAGLALQISVTAQELRRIPVMPGESAVARYPDHMMIRVRRRMISLAVDDIAWIEAASQYSRVHTPGGEHLLSRSLGSLACELDPDRFLRVHRSAIVNASHVSELCSCGDGRYYVVLRSGRTHWVGRTHRAVLKKLRQASFSSGR
jgi:two-component system, LytTR family, response regulator